MLLASLRVYSQKISTAKEKNSTDASAASARFSISGQKMEEISTGFERWDDQDRIGRHQKHPQSMLGLVISNQLNYLTFLVGIGWMNACWVIFDGRVCLGII